MTDTTSTPRWIEYRKVRDLPPALRNSKRHADDDLDTSLGRWGYTEPVLIDERTGRLVAGHGRRDGVIRAEATGEAPPDGIVVDADGDWTLPIVRGWSSANDEEAEAYLVASNRLTEKGGWDLPDLADVLAGLNAGAGLAGTGYTPTDLDALLSSLMPDDPEPAPGDRQDREGRPARETAPARAARGDLWLLGPHRLLVGDSFDAADRARLIGPDPVDLIVTDPPYAIYGSSTGIASDIADDAMVRPFFERLGSALAENLVEFGHAYVCCDWRSYASLWPGLKSAGLSPRNCIVWDKGGGLGSNYMNAHEWVAFFSKLPRQNAMGDTRSGQRLVHQTNVYRASRPTGDERWHNAAKPVALFEWLMTNSSDHGARVLDLFAGSGTAAIAAQRCGRVALLMEHDARTADVILERWEQATGVPAAKE